MISTLNPTFIFPASFIPSHKELFNFAGITPNIRESGEDKDLDDANGNVIQENINGNPHIKREYNGLNQLVAVRNATNNNYIEKYTYHPTEERVLIKKVYYLNTSLKETVYYVSDEFVRVVNTSGTYNTVYVKHEGQLIAEQRNNTNKLFYHPDHLGSTTLITNQKRIQFNIKNYYYPLTATWGIKSDGDIYQ